jgi:hypothetical protein
MKLLDFIKKFPDEKACRLYLKNKREQSGLTCKCGCEKLYWLEAKSCWQCSSCNSRRNLKAGTMMEKSKLPIYYWFMTIHLLTSTKKSFSALAIQNQLGHNRYEPIWFMVRKIRLKMGQRDSKYKLRGRIEIDEAFFEVVNMEMKGQKLKRGRGSQRQLPVLIMVESVPLNETELNRKTNKHTPNRKVGHVKMIVLNDTKKKTINYEVGNAIDFNSTVDSDAWRGYAGLKKVVETHNSSVIPKKEAHKKLPWVHTLISNAKRLLLGVNHSIGKDYLQSYLNEYVYKLNRRYLDEEDDMFDRMLVAGVDGSWNK